MHGNLMILRASREGLHQTVQRMFVLRDGVLCFDSEKKRTLLKRVCDVKCVNMRLSGKINTFHNCITMVYTEQEVENSVTLGTHNAAHTYTHSLFGSSSWFSGDPIDFSGGHIH